MLQELTIDNLAIIEHLTLDFSDQMTVLTGETGAGKSIIIDAVGLLAGNRGSQEFIRHGEEKLHLQGQFTLPDDQRFFALLDDLGIERDDGTLIISREIHRNGRNVIRVNGALINTATSVESVLIWLILKAKRSSAARCNQKTICTCSISLPPTRLSRCCPNIKRPISAMPN